VDWDAGEAGGAGQWAFGQGGGDTGLTSAEHRSCLGHAGWQMEKHSNAHALR
jgi:hypothetical protein